jgi:hypothetical protein
MGQSACWAEKAENQRGGEKEIFYFFFFFSNISNAFFNSF